jgi:hypothetical protein
VLYFCVTLHSDAPRFVEIRMPPSSLAAPPSVMNLTLPADLIWTVAVTPLEEQLPQPTKAPPQPIAILKCADSPARASQLSISSP